jgi:hypothetical protein
MGGFNSSEAIRESRHSRRGALHPESNAGAKAGERREKSQWMIPGSMLDARYPMPV